MNTSLFRHLGALFASAALIAVRSHAAVPGSSTVTAEDRKDQYVLSNGILRLTVDKHTGQIVTLEKLSADGKALSLGNAKTALYFDANADVDVPPPGETPVKKGYHRIDGTVTETKLVQTSPEQAEVVISAAPAPFFAFAVDIHYVLFSGQSGYYAYVAYHHSQNAPAATLYQTRFVAKANVPTVFDHYVVDAKHITAVPTATVTKQVADATFALDDGSVKTKYMQSVYWGDHLAYGDTGNGIGLWAITPSPEFFNGGPIKQGQTVHDDNVLRVLQSVHFGASPLHFTQGEAWDKVYGPIFFYVNSGPTTEAMLADAEHQQKSESSKWPYSWVTAPAYTKARGTVQGHLVRADGGSVANTWVILAQPGGDWAAQGKGYEFWTRSDSKGSFTLPKVALGSYTLYAVGADQPEQFARERVTVTANETTRLGDLPWKPVTHGERLWQIGIFDRNAGEFRDGSAARDFQMFDHYPKEFPNDVDYTVGKSDWARDWNYAQWTWYSKIPYWTIRFTASPAQTHGKATLTIGFASAQPVQGKETNLQVKVNGNLIDTIHLPKTGTAGYRGGVQDSQYNVRYLTFDATLLHPGENTITLGHAEAISFPPGGVSADGPTGQGVGQVMYDALRLEVAP